MQELKKYKLSENYCIRKVADLTILVNICNNTLFGIDDNTYEILSMLNDHDCSIEEMFLRLPKDAQTDDCRNNLNQLIKVLNDKGIIEVYDEFCRS